MHAVPLAGRVLGGLGDGFVIAQWTVKVGDHWIAPLHVHHEDDEAWYVLRGKLGFRLGDEEFEVGRRVSGVGASWDAAYVEERRKRRG